MMPVILPMVLPTGGSGGIGGAPSLRGCLIVIAVWLICALLANGAMLPCIQHEYLNCDYAVLNYRKDLAFTTGFSLLTGPLGLAMSPFITGFYQHGWSLLPWKCEGTK